MESKWSPDFRVSSRPEKADAAFFVHNKGIEPLSTVPSVLSFSIRCLIALIFTLPWQVRQFLRRLIRKT